MQHSEILHAEIKSKILFGTDTNLLNYDENRFDYESVPSYGSEVDTNIISSATPFPMPSYPKNTIGKVSLKSLVSSRFSKIKLNEMDAKLVAPGTMSNSGFTQENDTHSVHHRYASSTPVCFFMFCFLNNAIIIFNTL